MTTKRYETAADLLADRISPTYATTTAEMGKLVKTKGLAILWRGLGPTLWRDVPFSGQSTLHSGVYTANNQVYTGQDSKSSKLNFHNPDPTSHHSPPLSYPVHYQERFPHYSLNLSTSSRPVDRYSPLHPIVHLQHSIRMLRQSLLLCMSSRRKVSERSWRV